MKCPACGSQRFSLSRTDRTDIDLAHRTATAAVATSAEVRCRGCRQEVRSCDVDLWDAIVNVQAI